MTALFAMLSQAHSLAIHTSCSLSIYLSLSFRLSVRRCLRVSARLYLRARALALLFHASSLFFYLTFFSA